MNILKQAASSLRQWLQHRHLPWYLGLLAMLLCGVVPENPIRLVTDESSGTLSWVRAADTGRRSRDVGRLREQVAESEMIARTSTSDGQLK